MIGGLNRHIASIHVGKKPFQCEFCDKKFSSRQHFNIHRSVDHIHYCTECNKRFISKVHLKRHNMIGHEIKEENCDVSKMKVEFKAENNAISEPFHEMNSKHVDELLKEEISSHTLDFIENVCQMCGKIFNLKKEFESHIILCLRRGKDISESNIESIEQIEGNGNFGCRVLKLGM